MPERRHDLLEHGGDDVPNFGPRFTGRASQHPRVLFAGNGAPVVVVDHDEIAPPIKGDGETGAQADAQRRAQALRRQLGDAVKTG